tara:strand:- start:179 stop:409 length:231 start_codon:yes stop_codon:yes gene_type:complete
MKTETLMFKKAKELPTFSKILYFIFLSALWIFISSFLIESIQTNWIVSTLMIAWISSIFFGFNTKLKKEKEEKNNS